MNDVGYSLLGELGREELRETGVVKLSRSSFAEAEGEVIDDSPSRASL